MKILNRSSAIQRRDFWELRPIEAVPPEIMPVPGLAAEVDRRKREHPEPPGAIPPGRSVEGWLFYTFGYTPVVGAPSYDLLWVSVTGQCYGFRRTNRRPEPIPPAPADPNA